MKIKTFDCVDMKHRGAQAVIREIGHKKLPEELAYWRKAHKDLLKRKSHGTRE